MELGVEVSFKLKAVYRVRQLEERDVNDEYISWFNAPETTKYLSGVRPGTITIATQREYVRRILTSSNDAILGLLDSNDRLIGTSGIQKQNFSKVGPWVGVLIGSSEHRGLGLGTALIWVVTHLFFSHFDIKRTYAGIRVLDGAFNVASHNAFKNAGYQEDIPLDKEYNTDTGHKGRRVIVVSCSPYDLVAPEHIGLAEVSMSTSEYEGGSLISGL